MTLSMNRRSFLAQAVAASAAGAMPMAIAASPKAPADAPAKNGGLDALIRDERAGIAAAMAAHDIPAVAVCLLHGGRTAWIEGFGTTGGSAPVPVDERTIFSIQSTSKNFTAVGVLLAVQEGLLDLDAPVTRYLPGFSVRSRFEARPQERMTLRMLLSHRAGFTHEAPVGNNYEADSPGFQAHVDSISDTWLRCPVGERYRYSNLGYDLAASILQERTGMSYPEWLRRKLFVPLGMGDSTAAADDYTVRRNRALGHEAGHDRVPAVTPLVASGGVYTSARDMAAYAAFLLGRGKRADAALLDPRLWEEMHGFGLGGDYGLGVIRAELRHGQTPLRMYSHQGGGFGFGCVFAYCPEADLAWTAMFNRPVSAPYRFGRRLLDGALSLRFGARQPRLSARDIAPIRPTAALQRQLIGSYVGRNVKADIRLQPDGLVFDGEGNQTHGPLLAVSPDDFLVPAADGELAAYRFHAATSDLPAHLECFEGEASLDFNEGPEDPEGPDAGHWKRFEGRYRIFQWGRPALDVKVERRRGYLYINGIRLVVETERGLFFASDGEAVDFRLETPTWRSLRLQRLAKGDA